MPRTFTPPIHHEIDGEKWTTITVHRACNGCGRELGDATDEEIECAANDIPLPDVRDECGCAADEPTPGVFEAMGLPTVEVPIVGGEM